jgi:hypothetical protein
MLFGGYCHLRQKCVHLAKVQVTGVSRSLVCGIHNLALSFEAEVSLLQEFPRRERLLVPAPALLRTQHRLRFCLGLLNTLLKHRHQLDDLVGFFFLAGTGDSWPPN